MRSLALLLLLAPAANADIVRMRPYEPGNRSLGLQLGTSRPTEPAFRETVRPGVISNIHSLYYLSGWIAVGAELGYTRFFKKGFIAPAGLRSVPASTDYNSSAQAIGLAALVRVNFFESATWTPYVIGGAGFHRFEQTVDAAAFNPTLQTIETITTTGNTTGILVTTGAGIEVFTVRDASFSFEARFHQFRLDPDKFFGNAESLSLMLGFHYWWGRDW